MKGNIREVEQRLLILLKKNSRISILEAAEKLNVSRVTAKKAFDLLISEKRIKSFTVITDDDERDLAIVHLRDTSKVPVDLIVEDYTLLDGTSLIVINYEDLPKIGGLSIIDVEFATERKSGRNVGRLTNIHCDYCGKEISDSPIVFEIRGRTYYACCPNCERDMRRRQSREEKSASGG